MRTSLTVVCLVLMSACAVSAQVIRVPADQPTIQAGIMSAAKGDVVLVAEGTYYENINFMGKAITVASEYYLDQDERHIRRTIIDGSRPANPDIGSVVSFGPVRTRHPKLRGSHGAGRCTEQAHPCPRGH